MCSTGRKTIDNLPLQEYLRTQKFNTASDYRALEFLALDLEMTSLDVNAGEIVSVGFVPVVGGQIEIGRGFSALVRNTQTVGESATIHGIRDRDAAAGRALEEVFPSLVRGVARPGVAGASRQSGSGLSRSLLPQDLWRAFCRHGGGYHGH